KLGFDRAGNTLAIGLLVVQDGNRFGLDFFYDELGGGRTLLIVAPDGAEDHVVVLAIGDGRRSGRRRDHYNAFVVIDVGGGYGGAGTYVPNDITDFVVDHAVGHYRTLL